MRRIVVYHQKGGVGKTATVSNLARALVKAGERVLILDTDPQAYLSVSVLGTKDIKGLAECLLEGVGVRQYIATGTLRRH